MPPFIGLLNSGGVNLPSPSPITYMWNLGSLLGFCLLLQLISGVFLAMHYSCDTYTAFDSLSHIMRDVNSGWLLRMVHANSASAFFMFLYLHIARGLYFGSFNFVQVWLTGVVILFLLMGTAFLGYVLPWGQMSFWGATVITSLASAVPLVGDQIVVWLWGGFSVGNATLTRFFTLHFLLPFILTALALLHLVFLHSTGSSNPLGVDSNFDKTYFSPYFTLKDLLGLLGVIFVLSWVVAFAPWVAGDPENFIPANPMSTPIHIQPEWYFLFAYAVLRSIPNKLGGVVGLLASVAILLLAPFISSKKFKTISFSPLKKMAFWSFSISAVFLTWIGARPVEAPYVFTGQVLTVIYFLSFFMIL